MSLQDIKRISIRDYLADREIKPNLQKQDSGMYLSPLRNESNASFKVDYNKNLWYDFGTGEGGSIIDLVARIERCTIAEAIRLLETNKTSTTPLNFNNRQTDNTALSRITITTVGEVRHPALIEYLCDRNIDLNIARKYCNEVRYALGNRNLFAIGFKNDAGGWELRNRVFKGSSTPKNITTINNGSDTVMVFEGFMDFLSYLSLKQNPTPTIDTTVLNSVANLQKAFPFLESHSTVHAFLDNDESGRKALEKMVRLLPKSEVIDQSIFYRNHKDLNDFIRQKAAPKHQQKCPVRKKKGRGL